jgi:hypothetical protein
MGNIDSVAFAILAVSFLIVTLIGFASARWRPAEDPMHLNEWGLGGRGFGAFQADLAGAAGNNHSGAWSWHQLRGGHGKHSTRNGH